MYRNTIRPSFTVRRLLCRSTGREWPLQRHRFHSAPASLWEPPSEASEYLVEWAALAGASTPGTAIGDSGEAGAPSFITTIPTSVTQAGTVETTTITTLGARDRTGTRLTDRTPMVPTAEGSDPMENRMEAATATTA